MKRALIVGITGQDASYLCELLLEHNYEVHGIMRRSSTFSTQRIDHIIKDLNLHYADLNDALSCFEIIKEFQFDEIYNLGAQSHVAVSYENPIYTLDTNACGAMNLLESIRIATPWAKYYQASSSEMFGNSPAPQNEETRFDPQSPYACAKVAAFNLTKVYRNCYNMFACNGVLFNHESPRRGETFVTKKIAKAAARIKLGLQKRLFLGNLDAKRDWGFSGDYMKAAHMIMQHDVADDFVIATGETYSVRDFLNTAFTYLGLDWRDFVHIDKRYLRPGEVNVLKGDYTKAKEVLGWEPEVRFSGLVKMMIDYELEKNKTVKLCQCIGRKGSKRV